MGWEGISKNYGGFKENINLRILIVSRGFYPDQTPRSFRSTELALELSRQGHEVTVLAPNSMVRLNFCLDNSIEFIGLGEFAWRIPTFKAKGLYVVNKILHRALPLFFEYPSIEYFFKVRKAIKKLKDRKWDGLISVAVPHPIHWGVASCWHKKKELNLANTWIADCGDPYCIQENDTFQPPIYFHWIEKWFMRKVDWVSVPTPGSFKGYFKQFHGKIKVIPQGFKFPSKSEYNTFKEEVRNDEIKRFGYAGSFAPKRRDPTELLSFLTSLSKEEFKFEFHIYTKNTDFVEKYAKADNRIVSHGAISRSDLLKSLAQLDFVVNISNLGSIQTPSKLIDYAIVDRPILEITSGNLDKEVLLDFLKGNYQYSMQLPNIDVFRIENVANQFTQLMSHEE